MGKLIEGRFQKQSALEAEKVKDREDLDNFLNERVLAEMLRFLATLPGWDRHTAARNIQMRQGLLREASNQQLYTWVNRSSAQGAEGWQAKPSFYAAVFEELDSRGLVRHE